MSDFRGRVLLGVGALVAFVVLYHDPSTPSTTAYERPTNADLDRAIAKLAPHRQRDAAQHKPTNRVLLTGAAGFVGYHTALRLHDEGDTVLGIDNFNPYYPVELKRARAANLARAAEAGAPLALVHGDVCDGALLEELLRRANVTHVIHLAAQAGVRYSLKKPLAYVEANVRCFVTLLEAVKAVDKRIPIIYASSSSVYGLNTKVPFSEKDRIDSQASLYGATKQSNERIAHVYHHLHKLRLTGLRFFTVYGPYGRPDMAYWSFTDAILKGKPIVEYRNADGSELMRDFTYISDIVSGVVASMRLGADLEVFNLGNTRPEKVSQLIALLEDGLGIRANITRAPISAGDVPMTYADVSHAAARLNYSPMVSLSTGIEHFLKWYSRFYHVTLAKNRKVGKRRRQRRPTHH